MFQAFLCSYCLTHLLLSQSRPPLKHTHTHTGDGNHTQFFILRFSFFSLLLMPTQLCDMWSTNYTLAFPSLCNHLYWINRSPEDKFQHPPHFLPSPWGRIWRAHFVSPAPVYWQQQSFVPKMFCFLKNGYSILQSGQLSTGSSDHLEFSYSLPCMISF